MFRRKFYVKLAGTLLAIGIACFAGAQASGSDPVAMPEAHSCQVVLSKTLPLAWHQGQGDCVISYGDCDDFIFGAETNGGANHGQP